MCLIIFGHGWCWCNRAPWCGNCWTPAVPFRAICSHASLQLPQLPSVQLRLSNRGLRQQSFQPTSRQQRRAGSLKGDAVYLLQWLCFPFVIIHNVQFIKVCAFPARQNSVHVFQGQFFGAVLRNVLAFPIRSKQPSEEKYPLIWQERLRSEAYGSLHILWCWFWPAEGAALSNSLKSCYCSSSFSNLLRVVLLMYNSPGLIQL